MTQSLLSNMRSSNPFMRISASVAIVTFLMLILMPTAMAAQTISNTPTPQNPSPQNTPAAAPNIEAELSETIQKIQKKMGKLQDKIAKKQDAGLEKGDLKDLHKKVKELDKKVVKKFNKIEQHLKDKGLSNVIMQRHYDMVANYRSELATMLQNLGEVELAKDDVELEKKVKKAKKHLDSKKHKRSHQPFDPENMPFKSVKSNEKNKPKKTKREFHAAGLYDSPLVKLAAHGEFKLDQLPGADDPAFLAETDEVVLSDVIRAKAAELQHDPVKIYNYVRNNVEWLPTWGAMQDADLTLGSLKGNAFDISSLLIALLRASGIPSRYVHGTIEMPIENFMNWAGGFTSAEGALRFAASGGIPVEGVVSGGVIKSSRMEHVFVEAAIDYLPSRGVKNLSADSWVSLDPSYKLYNYSPALNLEEFSGFDFESVGYEYLDSVVINEEEGWASSFNFQLLDESLRIIKSDYENYILNNSYITTNLQVVGGRKITNKKFIALPNTLPNRVIAIGVRSFNISAALQYKITFEFKGEAINNNIITIPYSKVNNENVSLSFKPATPEDEEILKSYYQDDNIADLDQLPVSLPSYLIKVIPLLKIDDKLILSGDIITLGEELLFSYNIHIPGGQGRAIITNVVAGSFLSLALVGGSVSAIRLSDAQTQIKTIDEVIKTGNQPSTRLLKVENLLSETFYAAILGYFAQYLSYGKYHGVRVGAVQSLLPSGGSYGFVPKVRLIFGLPVEVSTGGVAMDLNYVAVASGVLNGSRDDLLYYIRDMGVISSSLEHATSDQIYGKNDPAAESISAVKALAIASSQGQRIYHVDENNRMLALQNINLSSSTMSDILNALDSGMTVITHESPVSISGWTGAGYIILDPQTGSGAYLIEGGLNGSLLLGLITGYLFSLAMILASLPVSKFAPGVPQITIAITAILVYIGLMILVMEELLLDTIGCFAAGWAVGSGIGELLFKFMRARGVPKIPSANGFFMKALNKTGLAISALVAGAETCPIHEGK